MPMIRIIGREEGSGEHPGIWHIVQLHDILRLSPGRVRASRVDTACGTLIAEGPINVDLNRGTPPPTEPTCVLCHDRGMNAAAAADIREAVELGEARSEARSPWSGTSTPPDMSW